MNTTHTSKCPKGDSHSCSGLLLQTDMLEEMRATDPLLKAGKKSQFVTPTPWSWLLSASPDCSAQLQGLAGRPDLSQCLVGESKRGLGSLAQLSASGL